MHLVNVLLMTDTLKKASQEVFIISTGLNCPDTLKKKEDIPKS